MSSAFAGDAFAIIVIRIAWICSETKSRPCEWHPSDIRMLSSQTVSCLYSRLFPLGDEPDGDAGAGSVSSPYVLGSAICLQYLLIIFEVLDFSILSFRLKFKVSFAVR